MHTITYHSSFILGVFLTSANWADADLVPAISHFVGGGTVLDDRIYKIQSLSAWLAEEAELLLITPKNCGETHRSLSYSLREHFETAFSQLTERFVD